MEEGYLPKPKDLSIREKEDMLFFIGLFLIFFLTILYVTVIPFTQNLISGTDIMLPGGIGFEGIKAQE